ncbi:MAG: FHA domain-containing protein [Cyanobacteriota/Melainabacteria group bacterium]
MENKESNSVPTAFLVDLVSNRKIPVTTPRCRVGRDDLNDIVISGDQSISRFHFIISFENGQYLVQDAKSRHGTFLNGNQIGEPEPINDGDVLKIGVSLFWFVIEAVSAESGDSPKPVDVKEEVKTGEANLTATQEIDITRAEEVVAKVLAQEPPLDMEAKMGEVGSSSLGQLLEPLKGKSADSDNDDSSNAKAEDKKEEEDLLSKDLIKDALDKGDLNKVREEEEAKAKAEEEEAKAKAEEEEAKAKAEEEEAKAKAEEEEAKAKAEEEEAKAKAEEEEAKAKAEEEEAKARAEEEEAKAKAEEEEAKARAEEEEAKAKAEEEAREKAEAEAKAKEEEEAREKAEAEAKAKEEEEAREKAEAEAKAKEEEEERARAEAAEQELQSSDKNGNDKSISTTVDQMATTIPDWCKRYFSDELKSLNEELDELNEKIRNTQERIKEIEGQTALTKGLRNTLLTHRGDELIDACKKVLSLVGWKVTQSDEDKHELLLEGEDDRVAIARIIWTEENAERSHLGKLSISQTTYWCEKAIEPKCLLIVAKITEDEASEPADSTDTEVVNYAVKKNICLLSTLQLLAIYRDISLKDGSADDVKKEVLESKGWLDGYKIEPGDEVLEEDEEQPKGQTLSALLA